MSFNIFTVGILFLQSKIPLNELKCISYFKYYFFLRISEGLSLEKSAF